MLSAPGFSAYNTVCIYDLHNAYFHQQYFVNSKVRKLILQPTAGVTLGGRILGKIFVIQNLGKRVKN